MPELATLIHDWADNVTTDVAPVTLDEILHLTTTAPLHDRIHEPASPRRRLHRWLQVAAAVSLVALTLGALALFVVGDDADVADAPAPPAPQVPSALALFPRDADLTLHHGSAGDDGASITTAVGQRATAEEWQQFLGIDPATVRRILEWRRTNSELLIAIDGDFDLGAVETALATDPDWSEWTTTVERHGITVTVRGDHPTDPSIRTPFGGSRSHAVAIVDGTVVLARDPEVLMLALDRARQSDGTLGHVPDIGAMVDQATGLSSATLSLPVEDPPLWYDAWLSGQRAGAPTQATLAIRTAEGTDPDTIRGRIDDGLIFELRRVTLRVPTVEVRAVGRLITVEATYDAEPTDRDLDALLDAALLAAEDPGSGRSVWILLLVLLVIGVGALVVLDQRHAGGIDRPGGQGPYRSAHEWARLHSRGAGLWGGGGGGGGGGDWGGGDGGGGGGDG